MLQVFIEVLIFCTRTVEVMNVQTETLQFVKGTVLGPQVGSHTLSPLFCPG